MDFDNYSQPLNIIIESGDKNKGNLFLGSYEATDLHILKFYKIKAVLTAAIDPEELHYNKEDQISHLQLDIDDDEFYQINKHFKQTNAFIEENLLKTNVLVHCMAGISRSVTIVCAYLIQKEKKPAQTILDYVKQKRKQANPNEGFLNQLEYYSLENFT